VLDDRQELDDEQALGAGAAVALARWRRAIKLLVRLTLLLLVFCAGSSGMNT